METESAAEKTSSNNESTLRPLQWIKALATSRTRPRRNVSFLPYPPIFIPVEESGEIFQVRLPVEKGNALDLFSGTGSVGDRLKELGYNVISLDIDPKTNPTFPVDIMDWEYKEYPPGYFKFIAASVPCTEHSLAKTTAPRDLGSADDLVDRVLEIVEYFNPKVWWIENPRNGYLRFRRQVRQLPFVDIDYCRFIEWGYQKPTRFWGSPNLGELPHVECQGKLCKNIVRTPEGFHHRERLGGNEMHFSSAQKGRIPPLVIDYLIREGAYAPSIVPKSKLIGKENGF